MVHVFSCNWLVQPVWYVVHVMAPLPSVQEIWATYECYLNTHPFNGPFPGLPRWAGTRKVKPIWILQKQETVSGSRISWSICKSAPRSRQTTTPAPHQHHTVLRELKFESLWERWFNALNDVKPSELWTPHTTQLRTNVVLIPYSFLLDFYTAKTVTDYSEAEVPL